MEPSKNPKQMPSSASPTRPLLKVSQPFQMQRPLTLTPQSPLRAQLSAGWSALDPIERARHLRRFADVVGENIPKLAILESIVTGRALKEMNAQMARIPEWIEYFAGIAMGLEGESNVVKGGYVTVTHYEPLGPVALLTPWNHPVLILVKKMVRRWLRGTPAL